VFVEEQQRAPSRALCRVLALYVALEAGTGVSELARVPKQEAATNTTPCRLHGLSRGSPEGEVPRAPLPVDRDPWLVNVAIIHRGLTERLAGLTRAAVGGASEQAALVDVRVWVNFSTQPLVSGPSW